jgi:hypothetical protein
MKIASASKKMLIAPVHALTPGPRPATVPNCSTTHRDVHRPMGSPAAFSNAAGTGSFDGPEARESVTPESPHHVGEEKRLAAAKDASIVGLSPAT